MSKTHNKKRNVGVIYEILVKYIAQCLVEKNDRERKIASKIIRKYYAPDTEIYKEYRLFKSLVETTVSNNSVAGSIMFEAKKASKNLDEAKLDKEKSNLIREVNYQLNSSDVYKTKVDNYRLYATIQTVLNEWRKDFPSDIQVLATYEDKITTWLLESKKNDEFDIDDKKDVDSFVVKIMAEKFNDRYGSNLCQEQKSLLRKYVFSGGSDTVREEVETMVEVAKHRLSNYSTDSDYVMSKVARVSTKINEHDFSVLNDETVSKTLTLISMIKQLENENV
tara:strand:+ start:3111 stop:3947 length:837 start_codon:yes stop_codon:yes gene_type:complete